MEQERKSWNGQERRRGEQGNYKGDERRKSASMPDMPSGDLTGGDPGMSAADEEKDDRR